MCEMWNCLLIQKRWPCQSRIQSPNVHPQSSQHKVLSVRRQFIREKRRSLNISDVRLFSIESPQHKMSNGCCGRPKWHPRQKWVWAFRFTTPMCHLRWWHQTRIHLSFRKNIYIQSSVVVVVNARWYNLTYLTRPCRLCSLLIFCARRSNSIDPTDLTQRESRDDWSALVCVVCVRNLLPLLLLAVYFAIVQNR